MAMTFRSRARRRSRSRNHRRSHRLRLFLFRSRRMQAPHRHNPRTPWLQRRRHRTLLHLRNRHTLRLSRRRMPRLQRRSRRTLRRLRSHRMFVRHRRRSPSHCARPPSHPVYRQPSQCPSPRHCRRRPRHTPHLRCSRRTTQATRVPSHTALTRGAGCRSKYALSRPAARRPTPSARAQRAPLTECVPGGDASPGAHSILVWRETVKQRRLARSVRCAHEHAAGLSM
jgi:hypothetical protein